MKLEKILKFASTLVKLTTKEGDIVVDATVGNGKDTLFLAQLVKTKGRVYGFDIQHQAIENTHKLLTDHFIDNVFLNEIGHEHILDSIPKKHHKQISCAIFNLGYLPHGDHRITTTYETTIEAIKQLLMILKVSGIIVLVVYPGHPEGKKEKDELIKFVSNLNQKEVQVLEYRFMNQINDAPFIIALEKLI